MNPIQAAKAKIKSLRYDFKNYTLESFIEHVETFIGRRIQLLYLDMPSGLTGAWITDSEQRREYVFVAHNKPSFIQQQSIFHEVGHIIFGHSTLIITTSELRYLADKLSSIRFRSLHTDVEDKEAEALALLIQKELLHHARYSDLSGIENFADTIGMV